MNQTKSRQADKRSGNPLLYSEQRQAIVIGLLGVLLFIGTVIDAWHGSGRWWLGILMAIFAIAVALVRPRKKRPPRRYTGDIKPEYRRAMMLAVALGCAFYVALAIAAPALVAALSIAAAGSACLLVAAFMLARPLGRAKADS